MYVAKDCMLDLETLGTKPGCGILSIGACSVDGEVTFYTKVVVVSNEENGLVTDLNTLGWWRRQPAEAYNEAFTNPDNRVPLRIALEDFAVWLRTHGFSTANIWGNGADFDVPILGAAYDACGIPRPWKTFNGRCFRTMKEVFHQVPKPPFEGTKHNALADALHQAKWLQAIAAHITAKE